MAADSSKKNESPYKPGGGRVIEDDGGRRIWEGTIRHVKLSLMKTGVFQFSDQVSKQDKAADQPGQSPTIATDEDLDIAADDGGFNPYDSTAR